jgi:lipopolysaccharide cholinephosphotransferase
LRREIRLYTDEELECRHLGLKEIAAALERWSLRYLLFDGALLGIVREGNFIRWDDDVDLAVYAEDAPGRIFKVLDDLETAGFSLSLFRLGYWRIDLSKRDCKYTLQFYYEEDGMRRAGVIQHPRRFFEETATIEFKGRAYPCPADIEGYFARQYGTDWRTPKPVAPGTPMNKYIREECFKRDPLAQRVARRLASAIKSLIKR